MNTKKIDTYKAMAKNNAEKTRNAMQIAIGDFLFLITSLGKENGLHDHINKCQDGNSTLVKVVDIIEVSEDFDLLRGWMGRTAPKHRGGSKSCDVEDNRSPYNYTAEEIGTFYNLVTVYRNGKGQFIAVDCQGYDYWRYVYLSAYWRDMFAKEIGQITAECLEDLRLMREAENAKCEKQAEAYAAKCAELRARYPKMKENPRSAVGVTTNVKKWFAAEFPEYPVKVSTCSNYWGDAYHVQVTMSRGIPDEERTKIYKRIKMWDESMPTGMYEDYKPIYSKPMGIFGHIAHACLKVSFSDK